MSNKVLKLRWFAPGALVREHVKVTLLLSLRSTARRNRNCFVWGGKCRAVNLCHAIFLLSAPRSLIRNCKHFTFLCMLTWKGFLNGNKGYKQSSFFRRWRKAMVACRLPRELSSFPVRWKILRYSSQFFPFISMQVLTRVRSNKKSFEGFLVICIWEVCKIWEIVKHFGSCLECHSMH